MKLNLMKQERKLRRKAILSFMLFVI